MNPETKNKKLFEKNDIALFLAPITALFYGLAYVNEYGKYVYYGIPTSLIELDLNSLTESVISLSPLLLIVIIYSYRMILKIRKRKNKNDNDNGNDNDNFQIKGNKIHALFYLILSLQILGLFCYINYNFFGMYSYLVLFISFILFVFLIFIFIFYIKKEYLYSLAIFILYSIFQSYTLGYIEGAFNITHVIIKTDNHDFVLLETYKENFIIAPVNLKSKKISREISLKSISDKDYTIKRENVILKLE
jgi:hypothetical protein